MLVIDCSGSMDGSKLTNIRKAAKAFGEKLLAKGSSTRIAIVTYIDEAAAYNNGHFYTADELAAFNTAVDAATYAGGGSRTRRGKEHRRTAADACFYCRRYANERGSSCRVGAAR